MLQKNDYFCAQQSTDALTASTAQQDVAGKLMATQIHIDR